MHFLSFLQTSFTRRWNHVSFIAMVLIITTAAGGIFIGANAMRLFNDMRVEWQRFDQVSEQKITYLIKMHQYLGVSGFSQRLKTYLLHGDERLTALIDIDLDQALNAVRSYNLLDVNADETAALQTIKNLVLKSRTQVAKIPQLRAQGLSPAEIDLSIDLNPEAAIAALDQLRWAWRQQAAITQNAMNATSKTGENLVSMGWIFMPVMGLIGLIVFWLMNSLRCQVTAYEREKAALETSERKFRDMAANVPGVIFQWYERSGGERGYLYVSPRCQELYGVSADELQKNWQALSIHPEDKQRYLDTVKSAFEKRTDWSFEGRFVTPSGEEKWWRGISKPVPVNDEPINDEEVVFNGMIIDISLQKKMEHELRALATTDGLTGAYNRRHFIYEASLEVPRAKRYNSPLSVLMIDLDLFKKVNDTYGHAGGDSVLRQFVKTVNTFLRSQDVLGRIGGEEFALMLPETNIKGAVVLAERIRTGIQNLAVAWDKTTIKITASIGVSTLQPGDSDIHDIMAKADQALYTAKAEGRNRVACHGGEIKLSGDTTPELLTLSSAPPGPHGAN